MVVVPDVPINACNVEEPVTKRFPEVKLELVPEVPMKLVIVVEARVEDAEETNPCPSSSVVLVASCPVERVVNGKAKVEAAGNAVRQSPFKHNVPVASVVEVALVVVAKFAVND